MDHFCFVDFDLIHFSLFDKVALKFVR
jgi:hypothetical protein